MDYIFTDKITKRKEVKVNQTDTVRGRHSLDITQEGINIEMKQNSVMPQ